MKKTLTINVWKYLTGVLFMCLSLNVQAQTPSVAIVPSGPIVCAGTKLDAIVTNLTGPYTYQWNTGATTSSIVVTQTGFYRVTVGGTVNGTTRKIRSPWVPLLVIPLTNAMISANNTTLCPGQSATLTSSGGQFFSSYAWSTGSHARNITVNSTGNYTLTITNNFGSCNTSSSASVHITAIDSSYVPTITAVTPAIVCQPGYVTLAADSGLSGYSWSTGDTTRNTTILLDGTQMPILDTLTVYLTVQVNNTCEFTNPNGFVIRSIREPELTSAYCGNFTLSATDSIRSGLVLTYLTSVPKYEFEFEETTHPGVIWTYTSNTRWANFANITPSLQNGKFYNVRVRAVIDNIPYCYGDVCQIGLSPLRLSGTSISAHNDGTSIESSVFPNPSTSTFNLVLNNLTADQSTSVKVSDISGRLIGEYQYDVNAGSLQFGQELTNGIYLINVQQGEASSVTRIVKTN